MAVDLFEVPTDDDHHILSIQSHVVRGYVGNRACGLVLQLLGHEVDMINTVDFASMYVHEGRVLTKDDFVKIYRGLFKALSRREGADVRHQESGDSVSDPLIRHDFPILMTGYTGDAQVIKEVTNVAEKLKQATCTSILGKSLRGLLPRWDDNCLWLLDPVMGDNNALYVSRNVESTYREVYKRADIITPNEYELKWLLNNKYSLNNSTDLLSAIRECHQQGPSVVILTSCQMENKFFSLCSVQSNNQDSTEATLVVSRFQKQDIYVGGCGDCFAALLIDRLKHVSKHGNAQTVSEAWQRIMHDVQSTLQKILTIANKRRWASINVVKSVDMLYMRDKDAKGSLDRSGSVVGTNSFIWNMNNIESGVSSIEKIFSS